MKRPPSARSIPSSSAGASSGLPLIYTQVATADLLLAVFCVYPIGTRFEASARCLAAQIGRSVAGVIAALQLLEMDGWIACDRDGRGTLVTILHSIEETPEAAPAEQPASDQPADHPGPTGDRSTDRPNPAAQSPATASDQLTDRSACMVHDLDQDQKKKKRFDRATFFETDDPEEAKKYAWCMAHPGMDPGVARDAARNCRGTLSDLQHDYATATGMPRIRDPLYYTLSRWRLGQRVAAPHVGRPAPSGPAAAPRPPSRPPDRAQAAGPAGAAPAPPSGPAEAPDAGPVWFAPADVLSRADRLLGPVTPDNIDRYTGDREAVIRAIYAGADDTAILAELEKRMRDPRRMQRRSPLAAGQQNRRMV